MVSVVVRSCQLDIDEEKRCKGWFQLCRVMGRRAELEVWKHTERLGVVYMEQWSVVDSGGLKSGENRQ